MTDKKLIGCIHNPRVPEAAEFAKSLLKKLGLESRSWLLSATDLDVDSDLLEDTSVIVTAGGDGTILRAVRIAAPYGVPILGINMGRVGFMTEVSVDEAKKKIPFYLDGSPRVERRLMLESSVTSRDTGESRLTLHALNDAVVSRGAVAHLLDIDLMIDGVQVATYRADGVIAATPTGSTGYALSAGGPVLYPEARVLLIEPLAAHISLQTGLVVPDESILELSVAGGDEAGLSVDAITGATLGPDEKVVVRKSPYTARFLRADPPTVFYSTLTQRLGVVDRTR